MTKNSLFRHPLRVPYGYLERAAHWLGSDEAIGIFYAALELRMACEQIIINHALVSDTCSKSFTKLDSKPGELFAVIADELRSTLDLQKSYRFFLDVRDPLTTMGYYLAVPSALFDAHGKLGRLLHAHWAVRVGTAEWRVRETEQLRAIWTTVLPHTHPDNRLSVASLPNIQAEVVDTTALDQRFRSGVAALLPTRE